MASYGDLPTGRRGHYVCPFCKHVEITEEAMIEHRAQGGCADKNGLLRSGALDEVR